MDIIEQKTKAPRSAVALYAKLYCKKKKQKSKNTNRILAEATKSWLSLTEKEKLEFTNKFIECKALFRKKVANQLKNSKPYMKKKRKLKSNEFGDDIASSEKIINSNVNDDGNISQLSATENNPISSHHYPSHDEILDNSKSKEDPNENEYTVPTSPIEDMHPVEKEVEVLEPAPPVLLSAQELFNMIQTDTDKTWADLSPAQRRQYQYAILAIKKNYLKQYRLYLESLSATKLIEHYRNVKNDLIYD